VDIQSNEPPPVFDFLQCGLNDKDRSVRVDAGYDFLFLLGGQITYIVLPCIVAHFQI
jgi:hypothetical protein